MAGMGSAGHEPGQLVDAVLSEMERLRAENARLLARCERYEGALRHYADGKNWKDTDQCHDLQDLYLPVADGWAVAREALAGEEGAK